MGSSYLFFGQVHGCFRDVLFCHRFDKQTGSADVILVVDGESGLVLWEHHIMRSDQQQAVNQRYPAEQLSGELPENRHAVHGRLPEGSIPDRQEGIPQTQHISHDTFVRFVEQERFPPLRVNVRVRPEEGCKGSDLIPANQQLGLRIAKESTDVS